MGLAKFIAKDPYTPIATEKELEELIADMHGIINWSIQPKGNVTEMTVEYDRHIIGDELIKTALSGVGFKLKEICDQPEASEAEVQQALED